MIRDPSDGSVKEKHGSTSVDEQPSISGAAALNDLVSNDILRSTTSGIPVFEDIKTAILAGKVNPERLSPEWVYQRAWNDAIDFALTQISRVEKEHSLKSGFSPSTM